MKTTSTATGTKHLLLLLLSPLCDDDGHADDYLLSTTTTRLTTTTTIYDYILVATAPTPFQSTAAKPSQSGTAWPFPGRAS